MKLTGKNVGVNLTKGFLLWRLDIDQPYIFYIEDTKSIFVFSTIDKLKVFAKNLEYKIKKIDDGMEFVNSVKKAYMIALDPYITPDGNTRFYCVFPSEDVN